MKTKVLIIVCSLLVLLVSCTPEDNLVVYSASSDETSVNLYFVNVNSGEHQQITTMEYANYPSWSADGNNVVFSSYDGLYTIDKHGQKLTKIVETPNFDIHPLWSPDGSKIAFISQHVDNPNISDLRVVNVDGKGLITLAKDLGDIDYFSSFSWSPDGKRLAFSKPVNESREIFTINADGTELAQVTKLSTPSNVPPRQPAWSPDGKRIAFVTWNLLIINSDGTNLVQLETPGNPQYPKWSPNGKHIACRSSENVIVVDPTNGQITTLNEESSIADYSWSSQGDELAYFVIDDTLNIEKMNVDSKQRVQLTKDVGFYPWQSLAWQP